MRFLSGFVGLGFVLTVSCFISAGCQTRGVDQAIPEHTDRISDEVPIATVLGKDVSQQMVDTVVAEYLVRQILPPLLEQFRQEHGISASEAEIKGFLESPAFPFLDGDDSEEDARVRQRVAEHYVIEWKTAKGLYEEYGGIVIFQQSTPLDPVGAYRQFLMEQEQQGAFDIHDRYRAIFWDYFAQDYGPWVVSPEDVDFTVPWWLKTNE